MASHESIKSVSVIADSSILTGDIYRLVKATGVNTVGRAVAATDSPVGVLGENPAGPSAAGEAADPALQGLPIMLLAAGGRVPVKAGGTITAGQLLISDGEGRVTGVASQAALAADNVSVGIAFSSGEEDEIIEMLAQVQPSSESA